MAITIKAGSESYTVTTAKQQKFKDATGISTEVGLLKFLKEKMRDEVRRKAVQDAMLAGSEFNI